MDKMNFLKNLMNENLQVDSELYGEKINANVKRNDSRCEIIRATSDAANGLIDSAGSITDKFLPKAKVGELIDFAA